MYEIKVDETETPCRQCAQPRQAVRIHQSGEVSVAVFEALLADYRGRYPRLSMDAGGWWLAEECQHEPTVAPAPATSVETDRAALVALYHATGGPGWKDNTNWLSDVPMGEWYGVETDANGRISEIFLERSGLSGEIPRELGNMYKLESLYLAGNKFSGYVPVSLKDQLIIDFSDLGGLPFCP